MLPASNWGRQPEQTPKGLKVADTLFDNGQMAAAARIYVKLLEQHPDNIKILTRYARATYELGGYEEALRLYEQLGALTDYECRATVGMGKAQLKMARPIVAGQFFAQCLQMDPDNEAALVGRAIAYDAVDQSSLALVFYRRAIAQRPDEAGLRNNYALSLLVAGQIPAAIKELAAIAFTDKSTPQIRQNLALAYGLIGDVTAAAQVAALDLSPELVASNLKYYDYIRFLPDKTALKSLLFAGGRS